MQSFHALLNVCKHSSITCFSLNVIRVFLKFLQPFVDWLNQGCSLLDYVIYEAIHDVHEVAIEKPNNTLNSSYEQ